MIEIGLKDEVCLAACQILRGYLIWIYWFTFVEETWLNTLTTYYDQTIGNDLGDET